MSINEILKDKNKLLMIVPILLGILFAIVFFKKESQNAKDAENKGAFFEPEAEGEEKITNKIDAYKKEQEEIARQKRELEDSKVKGNDFYFDMQNDNDETIRRRIAKMQQDPMEEISDEYRGAGDVRESSFGEEMRQRLDDIEDKETLEEIIREAKKHESLREEMDKINKRLDSYGLSDTADVAKPILPKVTEVAEAKDTSIFIMENGRRRRRAQFTPPQKTNLIKAAIYGEQVIVSGSAVKMRLLEPLRIGTTIIPANTIFYGIASVGSSRLRITVENLRYGKYISPVAFTVYDSDASEGLNLPNNMKAEAARRMEQGILQGVQLPISSIGTLTSEVTSALTTTTQVAKQILNQSLAQVKVHLKANYNLYIKEETQEDREKREAEEAELERLYQQTLIEQNQPVKKNPLTRLIESL